MLKEEMVEKIKQPKYIILAFLIAVVLVLLVVYLVIFLCQEGLIDGGAKSKSTAVGDGLKLTDSEKQIVDQVKMVFNTTTSQATGGKSPNEIFYYLKHNYYNLSDDTKAMVKPYLLRPDDPESYLHSVYSTQQVGKESGWIDVAHAKEKGRPVYNKYLFTADQKIKVWYPEITIQQGKNDKKVALFEQSAKTIVAGYNSSMAYQQFKNLLGLDPPSDGVLGGDGKVDVYLVSSASELLKIGSSFSFAKASGVTISDVVYSKEEKGKVMSGFVIINADLDDKLLKAIAAHELFHVFQYNYEGPSLCQYLPDKDAWWMEATAVWSEHYAYPTMNSEQMRLQSFITSPETSLTQYNGEHEYGTYLFPFYLAQVYGDKIIKEVFDHCLASNIVNAIQKEVLSYKGVLDDFWLWNYNQDAAKKYIDAGGFPDVSVANAATTKQVYTKGQDISVTVPKMAPLSAQVTKVMVSSKNSKGKKIDKVKFDLSGYKNKSSNAAVRALIYTRDGKSHLEDWNGLNERVFDFTKGGNDDAMIVVMVLANADTKNTMEPSVIKIISLEAEESVSASYIEGTDSRKATYYSETAGSAIDISDSCIHTFKASGTSTGPGVIPEYYSNYPFLGKWRMDYSYKSECKKGTGGVNGVVTFDLSEAYYKMVTYKQALGAFAFKGLAPKTFGNELFGYLNLNNFWAELSDVKEDGAKVILGLHKQGPGVEVDTSPVVLTVKKGK